MTRENKVSADTVEVMQAKYDLVHDMATRLNALKGYETGYANPRKGKLIVNYNGQNYLVEVEPIFTQGDSTIENAMKEYSYLFR